MMMSTRASRFSVRPEMVFFALIGVLLGFGGCGVHQYALPQTLVRP